jgi:hypothetical protein
MIILLSAFDKCQEASEASDIKRMPCTQAFEFISTQGRKCPSGAMAAQPICNRQVSGSTPLSG